MNAKSQRSALHLVKMSASTYLYQPVKKDESVLKMRIKEITDTRLHYGYRRVHVMLSREAHMYNVKRVYFCIPRKACHCGLRKVCKTSGPPHGCETATA